MDNQAKVAPNNTLRQCEFCRWFTICSTGDSFCCCEQSENNGKFVSRTQDGCSHWEK